MTVGWKSVASRNGLPIGEAPVADAHLVAVAQFGGGKIVAAQAA